MIWPMILLVWYLPVVSSWKASIFNSQVKRLLLDSKVDERGKGKGKGTGARVLFLAVVKIAENDRTTTQCGRILVVLAVVKISR